MAKHPAGPAQPIDHFGDSTVEPKNAQIIYTCMEKSNFVHLRIFSAEVVEVLHEYFLFDLMKRLQKQNGKSLK